MRLSTKGQYALEAILTMASESPYSLISIQALGQKTGISTPYLEQIFANLRRAGLVKSTRGTQGGYALSRAQADITVGEILRAGEGSLAPVHCSEKGSEACAAFDYCLTSPLWQRMDKAISSVLENISLAELVSLWEDQKPGKYLDFSI